MGFNSAFKGLNNKKFVGLVLLKEISIVQSA
jgi:hypothetical protein